MGVDLLLIVSEGKKTDREVIDDYFSFVFNKGKKVRPDIPKEKSFTNARYRNELDWFEKKGYVLISERVYSDVRKVLDWQEIYELFDGLFESDKTIIYGDDIKKLIQMLKKAEEELIENENKGDPDWTDWKYTFETQVIALCEFALENNFGIQLSE